LFKFHMSGFLGFLGGGGGGGGGVCAQGFQFFSVMGQSK
jgi:hypothetical protein